MSSLFLFTLMTAEELCTILVNESEGSYCISQNYMYNYEVRNTCVTE